MYHNYFKLTQLRNRLFLWTVIYLSAQSIHGQDLISGGILKPEQANMDVRHYTINLNVDIHNQMVDGFCEVDVIVINAAETVLLDLTNLLTVKEVWSNNRRLTFTHQNDLIRITAPFSAGRHKIKIIYAGKPGISANPPWTGGFQWATDSLGRPWVAITCQGEGAKIYFPCKDHPSDEPNEGAELIITVPAPLVVAGPGVLINTFKKKNHITYHWKTGYTINNYCILFNIGYYQKVERTYTTVIGRRVPMVYYVLDYNLGRAEHHLNMLERSCRILEKYFGEYPWPNDKIGIAETPHLGMEHQTMNAYGNKYRYTKVGGQDFDWLLHHEFGHEWWANKISNTDWAHMWLQEGFTVYGDMLYYREMEGESSYLNMIKNLALNAQNKLPIVQGEQIDSDQSYHGDIYGKAAHFVHSLRFIIGDEKFFPALKTLATTPEFTFDNFVHTKQIQNFFSNVARKDLEPFFKLMLYTTNKLEIHVKQTKPTTYTIKISNLTMELPLEILDDDEIITLTVSQNPVTFESKTIPIIDPHYHYLRKIILE